MCVLVVVGFGFLGILVVNVYLVVIVGVKNCDNCLVRVLV